MRLGKAFYSAAVLAGLGLLALGSGEAKAAFTVSLDGAGPTGSGPFTYSYTATIAAGDTLTAGDFFRIVDFNGFTGTTTTPVGWTLTTPNVSSLNPPNVTLTHGDDPAVPNLVWTYNGPASVNGAAAFTGFSADSIYGPATTLKDFVGRVSKTGSPGSFNDSVGDIRVGAVPEPSSMISGGLGMILLGIGYAYRTRRKLSA